MEHRKVKIAVVISVISVIIAIISLGFSFYTGMKDVSYKENIQKIQEVSQELQKRGFEFDENYKKISLAEENIAEQMDNCNKIDENKLNDNLKLLINSRSSLIKNDYVSANAYLSKVNVDEICAGELSVKDYSLYWFIGIIVAIWVVLIIAFFRVRRK